jgi:glutamate-1-semialdehyde 2,1-aminomutase
MAVLGGKKEYMDRFIDPNPARRVLLAGTYNSHPVPTIAAIATIERLMMDDGEVYRHVEQLGARMQRGLEEIARDAQIDAVVARQGSAFCLYFMDHLPQDWHDLAENHTFDIDAELRRALIGRGVYPFPLATKQWSISAAHTAQDIDYTLEQIASLLRQPTYAGAAP